MKHYQNPHCILDHYIIHTKTLAVLPAKEIEYQSIIIETDAIYHTRKTPLEIMKATCIANWTTFEGRQKAAIKRTGYSYKVPIIIQTTPPIVAIPTKSPKHPDCIWMMTNQIQHLDKHQRKSSTVIFHTNFKLKLPISYHTLQTQQQRAYALQFLLDNPYMHLKTPCDVHTKHMIPISPSMSQIAKENTIQT